LRRVTAIEDVTVPGGTLVSLHVLAAAASGADNSALLVVALIALAVYLASVWFNPFAPCRRCKGSPKTYGVIFTKAFDLCRHCEGRGRRMRFGARLFPRNQNIK
ncbi:MAG: hypothetical protein L0I24_22955, partial [Pseudonocardia sp.]|nr:hypothetical protein [Pseudonocardia sp.]